MSNIHHFHPFSVHFPIALQLMGFVVFSLFMIYRKQQQLFTIAMFLIFASLFGMGIAYISGEFFTPELSGKMHELKELHEFFAKLLSFVTLGGIVFWITLKNKYPSIALWIFFISVFISSMLILYTGYLGGSLVYDIMIPKELL